jgi:carbamoyl-phosphate synthase large subunit
MSKIPYFTTVAGMQAAVSAIAAVQQDGFRCTPLQDYYTRTYLD